MTSPVIVRPARLEDFDAWLPLWAGYNQFYDRVGASALPDEVTQLTWQRFFDPAEPVFGLVAELEGELVGLSHYLFHRSTSRIEPVCYLQDLFTLLDRRGHGIGKALIRGVAEAATAAGAKRVYWQTQDSNATARRLYDKVARHHGFIVYSLDA